MTQDFEGRTEKDAIDKAVKALGLDCDQFDVEILHAEEKKGFFGKSGSVKIRVYYQKTSNTPDATPPPARPPRDKSVPPTLLSEVELQGKAMDFLTALVQKMNINGQVHLISHQADESVFSIDSEDSSILIGRRGQVLEAIQILLNAYLSPLGGLDQNWRAFVDVEEYCVRKKEKLVQMAHAVAQDVVQTRQPYLLDEMTASDRRVIHRALNDNPDVETISEGEGLYKRVRVVYINNQ